MRLCVRCGKHYQHTNFMERRNANDGGGWDPVECWWWNTHTLACAKRLLIESLTGWQFNSRVYLNNPETGRPWTEADLKSATPASG